MCVCVPYQLAFAPAASTLLDQRSLARSLVLNASFPSLRTQAPAAATKVHFIHYTTTTLDCASSPSLVALGLASLLRGPPTLVHTHMHTTRCKSREIAIHTHTARERERERESERRKKKGKSAKEKTGEGVEGNKMERKCKWRRKRNVLPAVISLRIVNPIYSD